MKSIKGTGYSEFKYHGVLAHDTQFKKEILSKEIYNRSFGDHCVDIFKALYQKDVEYNDPCDPVIKNLFDSVKDTQDFKVLKDRTFNKPVSAFLAMQEMLPKLRETMEQLKEQGNKPLDSKAKDEVRLAMRTAIRRSQEKVEDVENAIDVLGIGKGGGLFQPQDIGDALTIAKRVASHPTFKKIMDMAGRLMRSAESVMKTDCSKTQEILIGATLSDELEEVLPEEHLKDSDQFIIDMADGNLACNKYKGKAPKDKGTIELLVDRSGSMKYGNGFAFEFSNSMMYAAFIIAQNTNRKLCVHLFSDSVVTFEVNSLQDILKIMEHFEGGETDFEAGLNAALHHIDSDPEFKEADIIFITDGAGSLSENALNKILEMKSRISLKILSLMIGYNCSSLTSFSDKVFSCHSEASAKDFCEEVFTL